MSIEKILVVDDDSLSRDFVVETLRQADYEVSAAANGAQAVEKLQDEVFEVVITDLRMPDLSGLELLQQAKAAAPQTTVVIMTAYGTVETAVEAMRNGAYDYLLKPFTPDQLELVLSRIGEHQALLDENRYLRAQFGRDEVVGESPGMQEIYDKVSMVAPSRASVLIQGETGTGKEVLARLIHYNSPRRDQPFIKVNCAALSENLLESEMFGHEKGAFTGAAEKRPGRFELADGGTLLLDEISEISPGLQAKLLRVLEEEEFERVGGAKTIKVDVRIISTTNLDLRQQIDEGLFREDLYYRLNVVPLVLPPLRARREDIPLLAEHFLEAFCRDNHKRIRTISKATLELLCAYDWPGNVRELRNIMHRAVVLNNSETLRPEHFACDLTPTAHPPRALEVGQSLEEVERDLILKTLESTHGNKTAAAKILKVTARTLRNKLDRYEQLGWIESRSFGLATAEAAG